MAGTSVLDDIELIIEDIGGGGKPPAGRDGGDSGDGGKRDPGSSSARKYAIAIALAMVAILMFFMAIVAAFLVLRATSTSDKWNTFRVPALLWFNTIVLLSSSATLELARKRLSALDPSGFKKLWMLTTSLGIAFVLGQIIAWRELVVAGNDACSRRGSHFVLLAFYGRALGLLADAFVSGKWLALVAHKFGNHSGNTLDFVFAQFRIHRQRQNLPRDVLRVWKISKLVSQPRIERLQMQRHRIVDRASDFSFAQKLLQRIPLRGANRVLMKNVFVAVARNRRANSGDSGQQI